MKESEYRRKKMILDISAVICILALFVFFAFIISERLELATECYRSSEYKPLQINVTDTMNDLYMKEVVLNQDGTLEERRDEFDRKYFTIRIDMFKEEGIMQVKYNRTMIYNVVTNLTRVGCYAIRKIKN